MFEFVFSKEIGQSNVVNNKHQIVAKLRICNILIQSCQLS